MAGLQVDIYTSIGITWIAALVALSMRVAARQITRVKWWFDDYFSILAFLCATGYCAILIHWTLYWSLGNRMSDSLDNHAREKILYHARLLGFFNSLCYASSLACSKISILLLYWRLFRHSVNRIPIGCLLVISAIWLILRTFMLVFRCVPTRAIWDKTIAGAVCNINGDKFFLGTITTHFLLDVIILILPIVPILSLSLPLQQRFAVAGLFFLGAIVCVASCIVLVILVRFPDDTKQLPYDYATFCIWGAVEVNIAVVSGCCPLLRPVVRRVCPNIFPSAWTGSHPITPSRSAIRLSTIMTANKKREDEDSSTHNLADVGNAPLEYHECNVLTVGTHTTMSSDASDWTYAITTIQSDLSTVRVQQEATADAQHT